MTAPDHSRSGRTPAIAHVSSGAIKFQRDLDVLGHVFRDAAPRAHHDSPPGNAGYSQCEHASFGWRSACSAWEVSPDRRLSELHPVICRPSDVCVHYESPSQLFSASGIIRRRRLAARHCESSYLLSRPSASWATSSWRFIRPGHMGRAIGDMACIAPLSRVPDMPSKIQARATPTTPSPLSAIWPGGCRDARAGR